MLHENETDTGIKAYFILSDSETVVHEYATYHSVSHR